MKKSSTIFLQIVLVLIALAVLIFMLWEPQFEGRNIGATNFQIYFNDPFLAYAYLSSIAFFAVLYQAFKLVGLIGQDKVFSREALKSLGIIKYCSLFLVAAILAAELYLFIFMRGKDDIAGGVAMGLAMMFVFAVSTTTAAVFEKLLKNAVDKKSENDLTV